MRWVILSVTPNLDLVIGLPPRNKMAPPFCDNPKACPPCGGSAASDLPGARGVGALVIVPLLHGSSAHVYEGCFLIYFKNIPFGRMRPCLH